MTEWPRSSPFLLRANSASRFSGSSSGVLRDWRTFSRTRGRATGRPSNDNSVGNAACNKNCRNRCEKWLAEKDGRGRSERAKNHLGLIAVIRKGKRKGREIVRAPETASCLPRYRVVCRWFYARAKRRISREARVKCSSTYLSPGLLFFLLPLLHSSTKNTTPERGTLTD